MADFAWVQDHPDLLRRVGLEMICMERQRTGPCTNHWARETLISSSLPPHTALS